MVTQKDFLNRLAIDAKVRATASKALKAFANDPHEDNMRAYIEAWKALDLSECKTAEVRQAYLETL
jgi:hypothetical protein